MNIQLDEDESKILLNWLEQGTIQSLRREVLFQKIKSEIRKENNHAKTKGENEEGKDSAEASIS